MKYIFPLWGSFLNYIETNTSLILQASLLLLSGSLKSQWELLIINLSPQGKHLPQDTLGDSDRKLDSEASESQRSIHAAS